MAGDRRLAWHGKDVRIWNAQSGELAKTISSYDDEVTFSPDGRLLVIDSGSRYSVWNVDDWTPLVPWMTRAVPLFVGGGIAFSPDGRVLAIRDTSSSVKLLDTSTFSELATLRLTDGHSVPDHAGNLVNLARDNRREFKTPEFPIIMEEPANGGAAKPGGGMQKFRDAKKSGAEKTENAQSLTNPPLHCFRVRRRTP